MTSQTPASQPAEATASAQRLRRLRRRLAWLLVLGAYAALAFGWLVPIELSDSRPIQWAVWAAFMVRTFTFQAGIAVAFVALYALALRLWKPLLACVPLLCFTLGPVSASLLPKNPTTLSGDSITLMSCNLMVGSRSHDEVLKYIAERDPDVIFFQEYSPLSHEVLQQALKDKYAHIITGSREDAFGQGVYSKLAPVEQPKIFPPLSTRAKTKGISSIAEPQIRLVVKIGEREVVLQNVHDMPPSSATLLQEQVRYFHWLRDFVENEPRPVILAGDFNTTPATTGMQSLAAQGFRNSHALAGTGRGSTWVDLTWLRHLPGVRIDHVLMSKELSCDFAEVGPSNGSDHRPIVARVGFER